MWPATGVGWGEAELNAGLTILTHSVGTCRAMSKANRGRDVMCQCLLSNMTAKWEALSAFCSEGALVVPMNGMHDVRYCCCSWAVREHYFCSVKNETPRYH